jgi:hypothetical protein
VTGIEPVGQLDVAAVVDRREVDVGELEEAQHVGRLGREAVRAHLLVDDEMGEVFISRITGIVVIEEEDTERVRLTDAHAGNRRIGLARLHQKILVGEREVQAGVDVVACPRRLCGEERGKHTRHGQNAAHCYPLCRFESVGRYWFQG